MFDIGWVEMVVVVVVMIIVIGPKDLPAVLRTMGRWIAQVRTMARNFQDSIEEMAEETGLDKVRDEVRAIRDFRLEDEIEKTIDPEGELRDGIGADIKDGAAEGVLAGDSGMEATQTGEADADKVGPKDAPSEKNTKADSADPATGDKT